jgi:2,4-dichlorophenol 6-monooxygenase
MCDMPQDLMEPVLLHNAQNRGAKVRFDTEYLSLQQDDDGVTVRVRDRLRAEEYDLRAKYVIGADGGRSQVAADLGLPMHGQMGVAGSINIVFEADLSHLVADRPSVLYWVLQPGADVGGIGAGLVRMVRPWHKWLIVWGYDIDGPAPNLSEEYALSIVRKLVGDDTVKVSITSSSAWTVNQLYAERYLTGRVFCAGDAVHRHPPSNGLGSNTCIQDSYNLAWKLAAVLKGQAGPGLLETYTAERAPVGNQIVDRANQSIADTARVYDALGLTDTTDPDLMVEHMEARKQATPEAEKQRAALREAIAYKDYEFNCHGVEMNQRYESAAVVADGTPVEEPERDPQLYHQVTSRPGAKLPHAWLTTDHRRQVSTLDLGGHGRFTDVHGHRRGRLAACGGRGGEPARRRGCRRGHRARTGLRRPVRRLGAGPGDRGRRRAARPARQLRRLPARDHTGRGRGRDRAGGGAAPRAGSTGGRTDVTVQGPGWRPGR